MSFSYSKVDTFHSCPYKFKLRYIDKLEPLPDMSPTNALYIGTATHEGIEKRSLEAAIESYKSHYEELSNLHDLEMYKMSIMVPKAIEQIPEGEYEHKLACEDGFIGFIDCLVPVSEGVYDLLDFKCSNNISSYRNSPQIHVYKYYFEKLTGNIIRDLYYVFIPKSKLKLTEDINTNEAKQKIASELENKDIIFEKIEYDKLKVNYFFARKTMMEHAKAYEKRYSSSCGFCEYSAYCRTNGKDTSGLVQKEPEQVEHKQEYEPVSLF